MDISDPRHPRWRATNRSGPSTQPHSGEVVLKYHVPGAEHHVGDVVPIHEVVNNATKKNPQYRYRSGKSWYSHDVLGPKED